MQAAAGPPLRRTIEVLAPASPQERGAAGEHAVRAAGEAAAAAVSDDEQEADILPVDPRKLGYSRFLAGVELLRGKQYREAHAILDQSIQLSPGVAESYHSRGVAAMEMGRDKEAAQDFTISLALPDCPAHVRYQSHMFRATCKRRIGDLGGADADFKAAEDAADDPQRRAIARDSRMSLTMHRVKLRKEAASKKAKAPPVVHRYGSAVIEELEPEEGSHEQQEAQAHERAEAWQEAALKKAVEARGAAARAAKAHEAEFERILEENRARADRNAVRAARRRSAAAAAEAAARTAAAQQRASAPAIVAKEKTEIPIEVVDSAAEELAGGGRSGAASSLSGSASSRSSASKLRGYDSESESEEEAAEGEQKGEPRQQAQAASAPAAVESAGGGAAAGTGPAAPAPAAALLPDAELDGLKARADSLQQEGRADAAEELYVRYLAQRPADLRAWSNRAENCCKAQRWQEALDCCNEAFAVASPSHPLPRYKLFFRRGTAYQGAGRLQEALRDMEAAEAAAEAEGEERFKRQIAKRAASILQEMESRGIQPAAEPAPQGLQAAAASAGVPLPDSMPVVPPPPPHRAPLEPELEAAAAAGAGAGDGQAPAAGGAESEAAGGQSPGERLTAASQQAAERQAAAQALKQQSAEAREAGNAAYKQKQWEQALRHYQRASELDPGCKMALANAAATLLQLERWEDAIDAASQALMIDSQYLKARHRRAHAYLGAGNPQLAVMDMKFLAASMPNDRSVKADLARMEAAFAEEQRRAGFPDTYANNSVFNASF